MKMIKNVLYVVALYVRMGLESGMYAGNYEIERNLYLNQLENVKD